MALGFGRKQSAGEPGSPAGGHESISPATQIAGPGQAGAGEALAGSAPGATPEPLGRPAPPAAGAGGHAGGGQVRQRQAVVDRLRAQLKAAERELQKAQSLQKLKDHAQRRKLQQAAGALWFKLGLDEQDMTEIVNRFGASLPDAIRSALGIRRPSAGEPPADTAAPGQTAAGDAG